MGRMKVKASNCKKKRHLIADVPLSCPARTVAAKICDEGREKGVKHAVN